MTDQQEPFEPGRILIRLAGGVLLLLIISTSCAPERRGSSRGSTSILRIGVAEVDVAQIVRNLTLEALGKAGADGRIKPWLAKSWSVSQDGRTVLITLRPNAKSQDGSTVTARLVADALMKALPPIMGAAYEDVIRVSPAADDKVEISLSNRSPLLLEALEAPIEEGGGHAIATGPFVRVNSGNLTELQANQQYYLGPPNIDRIVLTVYPTVRGAWAEMLRNHVDMVYELGQDALESVQTATTINVFTFTRPYQYLILLNPQAPFLRSAAVRQALNLAIDRDRLMTRGLGGHGIASIGPVWPGNWATGESLDGFRFDPQTAANLLGKSAAISRVRPVLVFSCLATLENERLALAVKKQLEDLGVEMVVKEASLSQINDARLTRKFEAILVDAFSGPSLLRPYMRWHSRGLFNGGVYSSSAVDAALDSIRHAASDDEYRAGVVRFQKAILADPPAIFLAWSERARAVNSRFEVPAPEPGGDVLSVLRLWRPLSGDVPVPGSN